MAKKSTGINFLIQINKGTDASPNFITVGGQRGGKLNHSADAIDVTAKDSLGFKEFEYGFHEWDIAGDGVLIEDDEAFKLLEDAFFANEKVNIQMLTQGGNKYSGRAVISDFPIDAPYKDTATYNIKFKGDGKLIKTPVTP
jgi:TP901-1 family phage major tail protein